MVTRHTWRNMSTELFTRLLGWAVFLAVLALGTIAAAIVVALCVMLNRLLT